MEDHVPNRFPRLAALNLRSGSEPFDVNCRSGCLQAGYGVGLGREGLFAQGFRRGWGLCYKTCMTIRIIAVAALLAAFAYGFAELVSNPAASVISLRHVKSGRTRNARARVLGLPSKRVRPKAYLIRHLSGRSNRPAAPSSANYQSRSASVLFTPENATKQVA